MTIADRVTFIGGSPRSGTTLMTALLDGHPDLLVFPEEYLYLQPRRMPHKGTRNVLETVFKEKVLLRLQGRENFLDELHEEGREYGDLDYHRLEEAVRESFHLLLGQSKDQAEVPMRTFALIALMQGFARVMGKVKYSRWVIKHPLYELHWQQVFADFPDAKMIYMIRDPREVILSRSIKQNKKRHLKRGGSVAQWKAGDITLRPSIRFLSEWERSVASYHLINATFSGQIMSVRYEDLIASPGEIMSSVSRFLGVPWKEQLVTPSFFGIGWKGSSMQGRSFDGVNRSNVAKKHKLSSHYLWQIEAWLGTIMVNKPGEYVLSELLERIDVKALVSWLRGEGIKDFFRNRLRMVSNQRNRPIACPTTQVLT